MNSQTISVSKLNAVSKGDREYSFFALSSKFSSAYIFVITEGENDSIALLQSENTAAERLFDLLVDGELSACHLQYAVEDFNREAEMVIF